MKREKKFLVKVCIEKTYELISSTPDKAIEELHDNLEDNIPLSEEVFDYEVFERVIPQN